MSIINEYDSLFELALTYIPETCDPLDLEGLLHEEDMDRQPQQTPSKQDEMARSKTQKELKSTSKLKKSKDELSKFQIKEDLKKKQKAPSNLNPVIRRNNNNDPNQKKKQKRTQSQKPLKPIIPQGYKRIAEYIRDYQKTHQNFNPGYIDTDQTQRIQSRQSYKHATNYQDNQPFLNLSTSSNEREPMEEYELLQELDTSNNHHNKSISPPKKKVLHPKPWDDRTNPYASGWTQEVLRNHYNVEVKRQQPHHSKHNNLNDSSMSKKWVVRKTRAKTDHQVKEQTKNYEDDVPAQDYQQIIDQTKEKEEQADQIDLVDLMNTLYKNYDEYTDGTQNQLITKISINSAQQLPLYNVHFNETIEKASYVNKMLLVK